MNSVLSDIVLWQSVRFGALIVGGVFACLYAVGFCYRGPSIAKTVVKIVPVLAFALAAYVSFGAPLVIAGLVLSAVGDAALSRDGDKFFLIGLVGFAAAHLAYIAHFLILGGGLPVVLQAPWLLLALGAFALSTEFWLGPHTGNLRWPVRFYVVLITAMAVASVGLVARPIAMIGAFTFIASDFILAIQVFRMSKESVWQVPASVVLWILYILGQFGILAGSAWATSLFHL